MCHAWQAPRPALLMCQVWHAYPSPCQVYAINQSGFRPETWDGYRFVYGPLDADYPGDKSCKPMIFCLSTLNEKGLVNTGEKDYAERKKACRVKKWRWCASPLLPHVVTYSTPNVCDHTCAMHRITAEDLQVGKEGKEGEEIEEGEEPKLIWGSSDDESEEGEMPKLIWGSSDDESEEGAGVWPIYTYTNP